MASLGVARREKVIAMYLASDLVRLAMTERARQLYIEASSKYDIGERCFGTNRGEIRGDEHCVCKI